MNLFYNQYFILVTNSSNSRVSMLLGWQLVIILRAINHRYILFWYHN